MKRWTHDEVNDLGQDKGFLPEAYWPEDYVWEGADIRPRTAAEIAAAAVEEQGIGD